MDTRILAEKFWSKVEMLGPEDCWPWRAGITGHGYGGVYVSTPSGLKWRGAHVVALELHTGQLRPKGSVVMHACNNRKCCNPAHLSFGSVSANVQQAFDQGRKKSTKHRAVLSELSVQRIKIIGRALSVVKIAKMFGVSSSSIHHIRTGRNWSDIKSTRQALAA